MGNGQRVLGWVIGIDPGINGGICILGESGDVIEIGEMPIIQQFADIVEEVAPSHVFVEKCQPFKGQGISSTFKYADHFGQLQGVLVALKIPFTLVPPKTWQKVAFLGTAVNLAPKRRALAAASRLFPGQSFLATDRSRVPHDGMIDACLIALFGFRTLGGGEKC